MDWGDILEIKDGYDWNTHQAEPDYFLYVGESTQRDDEIRIIPFGYKRTKVSTKEKFKKVTNIYNLLN